MRLDKRQADYIKVLRQTDVYYPEGASELLKFLREVIDREADKASLTQSLRLGDLCSAIDIAVETLEKVTK